MSKFKVEDEVVFARKTKLYPFQDDHSALTIGKEYMVHGVDASGDYSSICVNNDEGSPWFMPEECFDLTSQYTGPLHIPSPEPDTAEYTLENWSTIELLEELVRRAEKRCRD